MKKKRIIEKLVLILIILLAVCAGKVNAAEMSPSLYFGITELKNNMGYSIGDPSTNGTTGSAAKIWNIVKYSSESSNDPTDTNVYCVKAGVGFASGSGTKSKQEYNVKYDMYTERTTIASQNDILNKLVNGGYYNHLLALANLLYIPGESTATERANLLSAAGIDEEDYGDGEQYQITDDEIESVQQAALWYFTNHGEDNGKYDQTGKDGSWLYYTTDGTTYESLKSYNPTNEIPSQSAGLDRQKQAGLLYEYLIKTATANASQYANGNGVHKNQLTLYAATKNNQAQPLMEVKKSAGKFDLALRKYITKINGTEVTNSRVPSIDIAKLKAGTETTATYKHRKDPEMVETGATVTYKLTVYNEGEVAGRATKIVDQLPTGLKYSKVNTAGYTASYDEGTNRLTLTKTGTNNLEAFNGTDLKSETIEIECKVEAIGANQILTNVAWIAEEVDENRTTIITEKGKDRDSEPGTTPTVNKDNMENYKGNTSNKDDLTDSSYFYKGEQDDDDFEKLRVKQITGSYNIELEKVDSKNNVTKLNGAEFSWKLPGSAETKTGTTANGKITLGTVSITDTANKDEITVTETKAPDGYKKLIDSVTVEITKGTSNGSYVATGVNIKTGGTTGTEVKLSGNTITITVPNEKLKEFDLALRKYITKVNEKEYNREPQVNISKLNKTDSEGNKITTAEYNHTKQPILVDTENIVVYTLRIYNEGELDGYANEITDYLPEELEFVKDNEINKNYEWTVSEDGRTVKTGYLSKEKEISDRNNLIKAFDGNTLQYKEVKIAVKVKSNTIANKKLTNIAEITKEVDKDGNNVTDRDSQPSNVNLPNDTDLPSYKDDEINKNYVPGQQDDDDFEKIQVREITGNYQLKLEKIDSQNNTTKLDGAEFSWKLPGSTETKTGTTANGTIDLGTVNITDITNKDEITITETKAPEGYKKLIDSLKIEITKEKLNGGFVAKDVSITSGGIDGTKVTIEGNIITITVPNEKLKEFDLALRKFITKVDDKNYDRAPKVDLSGLKTGTTAIYNHTKQPITVNKNSKIVYTIRVYNESELDGYAQEVTDYLPEGLEYLPTDEINIQYEWNISSDNRKVTTQYLSKEKETSQRQNKIKAFDGTTLSYKDVQIACKVKDSVNAGVKLTNMAEITKDYNEDNIHDKDSSTNNVNVPDDKDLPSYKDDEINKDYVPGQEDDDDFEKVVVKEFDLALRKFITKVDKQDVTTRIPEVKYDKANNKISYEHTKEPVEVVTGNVVEYTIRVYNEGDIDGYAKLISDDIPQGLEYLPDNSTNKEYRWVMYDKDGKETTKVEEATKISTDYLSKEQEKTAGGNLLKAFDKNGEITETNPDHKDVKVAFKVVEPNTSDKIIVNSAQISDDSDKDGNPIEDKDSVPDKWNEGEDDQDKEYIKLTYFDLALRKWVTEAIVIEDGKETVTQTGHTAEMDPEPVVKVELYRKDINKVTVKFRYKIRITNEGDIAGYAKEITDYVPAGLKFVAEDNPTWTDKGNNVITTNELENKLLQPGETAEVEVLLTWINGEDNMGQKTNIAEISKDYNDKGVPDRDSTPNNKQPGEDDIDDAPVLLSVETGRMKMYTALGLTVLVTLAGGIFLIKRYVL